MSSDDVSALGQETAETRVEPCTGGYGCGQTVTYWRCKRHSIGCTCQCGPVTPTWYVSVKTCQIHASAYDVTQTPEWWDAGTNEYVPQQQPKRSFLFRRGRR